MKGHIAHFVQSVVSLTYALCCQKYGTLFHALHKYVSTGSSDTSKELLAFLLVFCLLMSCPSYSFSWLFSVQLHLSNYKQFLSDINLRTSAFTLVLNNLIVIVSHLVIGIPPRDTSSILVDFIGQDISISLWRLLLLDLCVMALQILVFIVLNGLATHDDEQNLQQQQQPLEDQDQQESSSTYHNNSSYYQEEETRPSFKQQNQPHTHDTNGTYLGTPIVDIRWRYTLDRLRSSLNQNSSDPSSLSSSATAATAVDEGDVDTGAAEEHNLGTRAERPYPQYPLSPIR